METKLRFLQLTGAMVFTLIILCSALDKGYNPPAKGLNRIQGGFGAPENIQAAGRNMQHIGILPGHRKRLSEVLRAKMDDLRPTAPGHSPGIGHAGK
ncbi:hypothetical protein F511_08219 [Dorcoceras hygrometricum]|uniref:Uncharacterized protein n=1 Tax=Dorcoceras hygrometricum TaxID=472368 RepID=A0A2Z7C5D8_9LAMI|nr:hypothetical protein F511_08219 [Dorcoceras hygrometricum]